jgi:CheY-like chemotaxis protein
MLWPDPGDSEEKEICFTDMGGEVNWVNASISPLPVMGARGWMVVFRDQQAASQRLAGLEAISGGIAKQLSEHLDVILENASQALLGPLSDEQSEPIRRILEAAQNAAILKRQLKSITGEGAEFMACSLFDLVRDCIPLVSSILGEHLDVRLNLEGDDAWIHGDEAALRLGLVQLAEWIGRHHRHSGMVEITVGHPPDRPNRIVLRFAAPGLGLDEDTRQHLFEPLRAKQGRLGLAVVYGIVEQHQGRLLVNSTVENGTTFHMEFPECPPEEMERGRSEAAAGNETVFVVDDDPATIEVVSQLLEDQGFSVLTASNGLEASLLLRKEHRNIDVFLTDAVLPGRSGLELISEMRSLSPNMPVLLMSGYPAEFMGGQVLPDIPLLGKPFSPGTLIDRLRGLLDEDTH